MEVNLTPASANLVWRAGDHVTLRFPFTDAAGLPVDLSARTFVAEVRAGGDPVPFTVSKVNRAPDPGYPSVLLVTLVTGPLGSGVFGWELRETTGGQVRTLIAGRAVGEGDGV